MICLTLHEIELVFASLCLAVAPRQLRDDDEVFSLVNLNRLSKFMQYYSSLYLIDQNTCCSCINRFCHNRQNGGKSKC